MRYIGNIDESKIIKKGSEKATPINETNINEDLIDEQIIEPMQPIPKIEETVSIETRQNDFPVFMYEQNLHTKKVEVKNTLVKENIKLDIPFDKLQIININNEKNILELKLDLEVLKTFLVKSNPDFKFFKDKYDYLLKELSFLEKKDNIIKNALKNKK